VAVRTAAFDTASCESAKQDADGMTPLHYAASCEHEEMAQLLVGLHAEQHRLLVEDSRRCC
jgi:ankyrin repeat protein